MRLSVPVLVTDGEQRAALATVRSLGRAGYDVHVCGASARTLAGASRFVRSSRAVPNALEDPNAYVEAIAGVCDSLRIQLLLPLTEASLLALLPARERLVGVCLPFPDIDTFKAVCDKAEVLRRAEALGLAVPWQKMLKGPDELGKVWDLSFPVVLKPSRSVGDAGGRRVRLSVKYANDLSELRVIVDQLPKAAFPLLLQQRVTGPGIGIFLLLWRGRQLAVFSHRRIREKPPSGGVSVYRESVAADSALVEKSRRLLETFGWQGVAMVEYKVDEASGEPVVMEVNGRFWGSLQLAIDSGVDFPALLVRAALGDIPEPVTEYRVGVRSRWWWGDVDHLLLRLRRSRHELALPPGAPSRTQTVKNFLTIWRPRDRNEILRLTDPGPFVRESVDWLRQVVGRAKE